MHRKMEGGPYLYLTLLIAFCLSDIMALYIISGIVLRSSRKNYIIYQIYSAKRIIRGYLLGGISVIFFGIGFFLQISHYWKRMLIAFILGIILAPVIDYIIQYYLLGKIVASIMVIIAVYFIVYVRV